MKNKAITHGGRTFSFEEVALMRQAATDYAGLGRTEIARTVCEWLDWRRPSGSLKNHECRLLLERLEQQGVLTLPQVRPSGRRGPRPVNLNTQSNTQPPIDTPLAELKPLKLTLVEQSESALWRQFIHRYHYLGCCVPLGAHLRYWVRSRNDELLACLLWTSPAWKMAARDRWIGWTEAQRTQNLQSIVNHSRFLILPWVRVKGLASTILALSARKLPEHWRQCYGYTPQLLETLVDASRFKGTCYRAANWTYLGETTGRGRMDRHHQAHGKATKLIFVFPLHRRAQKNLCLLDPPASHSPSNS